MKSRSVGTGLYDFGWKATLDRVTIAAWRGSRGEGREDCFGVNTLVWQISSPTKGKSQAWTGGVGVGNINISLGQQRERFSYKCTVKDGLGRMIAFLIGQLFPIHV